MKSKVWMLPVLCAAGLWAALMPAAASAQPAGKSTALCLEKCEGRGGRVHPRHRLQYQAAGTGLLPQRHRQRL